MEEANWPENATWLLDTVKRVVLVGALLAAPPRDRHHLLWDEVADSLAETETVPSVSRGKSAR
jgi:hypothetical protein